MRLIKGQTAEILAVTGEKGFPGDYENSDKLIELAGRTCYKSEDKITSDSAKKFVEMLLERQHTAMLEHSWEGYFFPEGSWVDSLPLSPYLRSVNKSKDFLAGKYVVGNRRAFQDFRSQYIVSSGRDMFDVAYKVTEEEIKEVAWELNHPELLFMTVKFITNRGVTHELVRHRPPSFAQESTRYCNYSKEKFGEHCTFIIPSWCEHIPEGEYKKIEFEEVGLTVAEHAWLASMRFAEQYYFALLASGKKPEEARGVLPNDLKTEIVVTADFQEWKHILNLRYYGKAGVPHFQMKEMMTNFVHQLVVYDFSYFLLDL